MQKGHPHNDSPVHKGSTAKRSSDGAQEGFSTPPTRSKTGEHARYKLSRQKREISAQEIQQIAKRLNFYDSGDQSARSSSSSRQQHQQQQQNVQVHNQQPQQYNHVQHSPSQGVPVLRLTAHQQQQLSQMLRDPPHVIQGRLPDVPQNVRRQSNNMAGVSQQPHGTRPQNQGISVLKFR